MGTSPSTGNHDHVDHYWEHGYAVLRGVFGKDEMRAIQAESQRIYAQGLQHHAT